MDIKLVDIQDVASAPALRELTAEEEAALIARYRSERSPASLEADYSDLDRQIAEGVPAEQLIQQLHQELRAQ